MSERNGKLYQDPFIHYPVEGLEEDFQRYVKACETLISNTRQDIANNPIADAIIAANTPFELNPTDTTDTGVLLLHGLYDSPFVMQDLARHCQSIGLKARALLLPGHGTVPGALLNSHFQEWLDTVERGLKGLATHCEKVWIIGFSTGATLALYHAWKKTIPQLAGLILIAPAIEISPLSAITHLPIQCGIEWYHKQPDYDYAKYESFTFNSIYQLHLLIKTLQQISTETLDCPVLMVLSQDDKTISSDGARRYFHQHVNAASKMILYTNQTEPHAANIEYRHAAVPALHIQTISHIALPIAPSNKHYGQHGDYIAASRIDSAQGKRYGSANGYLNSCKNYLHKFGMYPHQFTRLTYNPDFAYLKTAISRFMATVDV